VASVCIDIKKVTVTDFRDRLKDYLKAARANRVVLVENQRQPAKYVVDKEFLDSLVKERESIIATLEILADRDLTDRLLRLSKTIDDDVVAERLLRTADVFGA
jgi:PHD/YefM family antitoxin component YafN of YafNO toxin-antitoxin module